MGWGLLLVAIAMGAGVGGAVATLAGRDPDAGPPEQPGPRWHRDPAALAGAAVPVAAAGFLPTPAAAAAAMVIGWLLLAIAIWDERTLLIPHVTWIAGTVLALSLAWSAGGWGAVAVRGLIVLAAATGFLASSYLARAVAGRPPVGTGDYGVLVFLGSLCGPAIVDVLLVGAVIALGCWVVPLLRERRAAGYLVTAAAALACLFGGVGGAVVGAGAQACVAARAARGRRVRIRVPLGACLALAAALVILCGNVPLAAGPFAVRHDPLLHHLQPADS